MFKIVIKDLEFYSIIGIYKHERRKHQKVSIDAKIEYDYLGEPWIMRKLPNLLKIL